MQDSNAIANVLNDFVIAFVSGTAGLLKEHLREDFIFSSPYIRRSLDAEIFAVYIGLKFNRLKDDADLPEVRIVEVEGQTAVLELKRKEVVNLLSLQFEGDKVIGAEVAPKNEVC